MSRKKYLNLDFVELKGLAEPEDGAEEGSDAWTFSGLLSPYSNVDSHKDVVAPGAFSKTLADGGNIVPILWQHEIKEPIGFGTLTETPKGLHLEGVLNPAVARASEARGLARQAIKMKAPFGLSMGYNTLESDRDVKNYPGARRRLTSVKVVEGSLVTFPSNHVARVLDAKDSPEETDMTEIAEALTKAASLTFAEMKEDGAPNLASAAAAHAALERVLSEAVGTKAALSFGEVEEAVRLAIKVAEFGTSGDEERGPYLWPRAMYADRVVYTRDGKHWQRTYTISGADVQLGPRVAVRQDWVPITEDAPKSEDVPPVETPAPEAKTEPDAGLSDLLAALLTVKSNLSTPAAA
jgi:HK97 family phage prohead protease